MTKNPTLNLLHAIALVVVFVGAAGSIVLTLHAGRNNNSVLLIALFVIWVLSPFIGLLVADAVAKDSALTIRLTLYLLMLVITVGSLVSYSSVFNPHTTKAAAVFLIVPLLSWIIMLIVILVVRAQLRRSDNI